MRRVQSIRARLGFVFLFLLLLVLAIGIESLGSLNLFNDASAQIRDRWLPATRALGDLNNFTTDFPGAGSALRRAQTASEISAIERQMVNLDREIAAAQSAYLQIGHDATETLLFTQFVEKWTAYRAVVNRGGPQRPSDKTSSAGYLDDAPSASAYAAAAEALEILTDHSIASARAADERSHVAYLQARSHIVLTMALAALLVGGAMVYVTRSVSAPLVDLAARMHRLAERETSIAVRGTGRHDEIGDMARAVVVFRNNAVDLATSRHALTQQAAMLEERLAAEQRLTLLQRNFVSMVSHEFRSPLALIDGHAQRLVSMRDRLTADEVGERSRKVRSAVRHMRQLIDNLIGSARLTDGRIHLQYRPTRVDLAALVREVCDTQRELTPDAAIFDRVEPPSLQVDGDAGLLSQLFGNLLSNAAKYSPPGAAIQVTAERSGAQILIAIEDHGIGIPGRDRQRIFERYFRGSNTSGIVGSGVGLSLVKTIVDLHGGMIEFDSREGEGSRFMVQLPAGSADVLMLRAGGERQPDGPNPAHSAGPHPARCETGRQ